MSKKNLLTKQQAADAFGLSVRQFDRKRRAMGIHPAPSLRSYPLLFDREYLERVARGRVGGIVAIRNLRAVKKGGSR
jgi:hypothetical protein